MPRLMDGRERVEMLTDAAIHLIDTDGVEGLTVRRLSALLRISPSTLTSHLTNKHRIIDLILKTSGSLLLSALDSAVRRRGLARCSRPDPLPRERAVEVLRHACRALDIEPELDRTA